MVHTHRWSYLLIRFFGSALKGAYVSLTSTQELLKASQLKIKMKNTHIELKSPFIEAGPGQKQYYPLLI